MTDAPTAEQALAPEIAGLLKRDAAGLVPAIIQEESSGAVLMLGWMDDVALHRTLTTGRTTFFSRSRNAYWTKGETSGHRQWVRGVRLDCDGDTLLVTVVQEGAACHTGDRTCFDARPLPALLRRLEQEGAGAARGQLPVDADRGLAVGEQPAHDRHDGLVERGELLRRRRGGAEPHDGLAASGSAAGVPSPTSMPAAVGSPVVAGRGAASKQVRSPVWQAPVPTWSTLTSNESPSQSSATDLTHCCEPDVSPLTQYSCRLRDQ